MQAIIVTHPGGPDVLELGEVPKPTLQPGEVLIEVVAVGVNRADLLQRQGHYAPPPGASETIGLEVSGHIAELGPEVTEWAVGDPCVALLAGGGYAAYVAVPTGQVMPPPPGLDLIGAAGVVEVAATVHSNLTAARLCSGETFLVQGGAGGIGSFAIQYAKARGATVFATAGRADKLDYCRSLGADHAVSYREDWPAAVEAIAPGGVDVILDNMGAKYLADHVRLLAPDGRLVVIGFQGGSSGTIDLAKLLTQRASVTATSLRGRPVDQKSEICRGLVDTVWPWLADRTIQPTRYRTFPLAEAGAAHSYLDSGDHLGKAVLIIKDQPVGG